MRKIQILHDRHGVRRAAGVPAIGERHHAPPGGDRRDHDALGVDGEATDATEVLGKDADAKAGGDRDLARLRGAEAEQYRHRALGGDA